MIDALLAEVGHGSGEERAVGAGGFADLGGEGEYLIGGVAVASGAVKLPEQSDPPSAAGKPFLERRELAVHPRAEQVELSRRFRAMGLSGPTADAVAREMHADPDLALRVHLSQEIGVSLDDQPSPWVAATSSFAAFAVGGLLPLLTFLLGFGSLPLGLAVGGAGLLVAGALTSRFTTRTWWGAAVRQLAFGAIAAGATYLVGMLIGVGVA